MNGFILHLQGPMMSFGDTGFGQLRPAGEFPSRSVVLGIVAAALGLERGSSRLLDLHREIRVHVATAIAGTTGVDYHTISAAGYAEYDPAKLRRTGVAGTNPVLSDRSYHLDAHFVALLESSNGDLLDECRQALINPVFTGYIGRRSCPPATPLRPVETEKPTVRGALEQAVIAARFIRGKTQRPGTREGISYIDIYLDGELPQAENESGWRAMARSFRRDLLTALPRSYVNRPVIHERLAMISEQSPMTNEEAFNDAP